MTEGGMSKTVFFGCLVGQQLANMAIAEEDAKCRMYFFFGLIVLIIIYWGKQTFLDYVMGKKKAND